MRASAAHASVRSTPPYRLRCSAARRRRDRLGDTWHLDELFVTCNSQRQYLSISTTRADALLREGVSMQETFDTVCEKRTSWNKAISRLYSWIRSWSR